MNETGSVIYCGIQGGVEIYLQSALGPVGYDVMVIGVEVPAFHKNFCHLLQGSPRSVKADDVFSKTLVPLYRCTQCHRED
jgi:hypothetical protein